jgi:hypothetical protein
MTKARVTSSRRAPLGRYANYFEVSHNAYEFLIDFGQYQPETADVVLHTRIAFGPTHAKLLAGMLAGAIGRHEAEHGVIADASTSIDPLEVVLRSLPDFERRAVKARRSVPSEPTAPPTGRSTAKR